MSKCYICDEELNTNSKSLEHIVLNGLGGHLKSNKILCEKHNNMYSKFDDELCNDLLFFTNILNPKRDRDENPQAYFKDENNNIVIRKANGDFFTKPKVTVNNSQNGGLEITINVFYSDTQGGQEYLSEKIQNIIKTSTKKLNIPEQRIIEEVTKIQNIIANEQTQQKRPKLFFECQFNKKGNIFISILKMVLGFYFYNNYSESYILPILESYKNADKKSSKLYINNNSNYYYPKNFYKEDSIYHTLVIIGNKENKLLYALVSLYGVLNTFILLNSDYIGENIYASYCYDLRNNKEVPFNNKLILDKKNVDNILIPKFQKEEINHALNNFMEFFASKTFNVEEFSKNVDKTFKEVYKEQKIFSKAEYKKWLNDAFYNLCKKDNECKTLKDIDIENWFKLIYSTYDYRKYMYPYYFNFLSDRILDCVYKIIFEQNKKLKNRDLFYRTLKNMLFSIKSNNTEINLLIKRDELKIKRALKAFCFNTHNEIYTKFFKKNLKYIQL